jgi:hypothetical protein
MVPSIHYGPMRYLSFDSSDNTQGVTTLEAMASTAFEDHAAVLAEVQQVLDWAWQQVAFTHGPVDDGNDWDHDLQVSVEDGRWHTVALTLSASAAFAEAFLEHFGAPQG